MTWVPQRALQPGSTYVVNIDSSARDVAGNAVSAPYPFQFDTSAAPLVGGGGIGDWIWILGILIAAAVGGTFLLLFMRQRSAAKRNPAAAVKPEQEAVIDDVFLLYNDGLLIKHETRRLKPDVDSDILSGMLTAVQQFVKDSFRSDEGDELNEMTFGQMHILLGRGKWLILAAIIGGGGVGAFPKQDKVCLQDMETPHRDPLPGWEGGRATTENI